MSLSGSKSSTDSLILKAFDEELFQSLSYPTKFAFANLATIILHQDFYEYGDVETRKFSENTLKKIFKVCNLPKSTNMSLLQQLYGNNITTDPTILIMTIKEGISDGCHNILMPICKILTFHLEDGIYDSRFRVFLRHLCALLSIDWDTLEDAEEYLVKMLTKGEHKESDGSRSTNITEHKKARLRDQKIKKIKRYVTIGAAGGIGGLLIGVSGGLAAPFVASGAAAIIGTTAATTALATTAGAAILGTAFGVAGAGLTSYKMKKRVGNIEQFEFVKFSEGCSLQTIIVVSGWITRNSENCAFTYPWRNLRASKEQYALVYESKYLLELGNALTYLLSGVVATAVQQTLMETALHGLLTAIAWPVALISIASMIDNPWNVCISRSVEIGEQLAETLLQRPNGHKPVTLIGFSLGARVIFHCLLKMASRPESRGIIDNVILLGAPVSASPAQWELTCKVVAGRIINGYSSNDWMLKFLYRTMSIQFSIAGISPIKFTNYNRHKIANHELSHIITGHFDYVSKLDDILDELGIKMETVDKRIPYSNEREEQEYISIRDSSNNIEEN
ncbi:Protein of unknown function DUF726 family-containing protein [Strongyloides ratti]|uniref:Transmembrane and coiled-coil domain-containing protein 4 n=1 Tax=Strongyloides ratti TaxID=34506 RepID=A0A090LNF5_STRRB|nr:Protein of unknown function DUF726 family-containing protein [Strongyloides ratti]CEF71266.1 Protein of unknown function DUF726 family-containing protein [Strongyloides ratti]